MTFEAIRGSDFDGSPVNIAQNRDAAGLLYRGVDIFSPDVLPIIPVQLTATGVVIPAVSGRRIRIMSLVLSAALGGNVRLSSGSSPAAGRIYIPANETVVINCMYGFFDTGVGDNFTLELTTINNLGVYGSYRLI